jgi:hypothetical protein
MTRLWPEGEPITVTLNAQGRPIRFAWQGHARTIHYIQQQWEVATDWWDPRGAVRRDYYAAITGDGLLCVIYHDLEHDAWKLSKLYD